MVTLSCCAFLGRALRISYSTVFKCALFCVKEAGAGEGNRGGAREFIVDIALCSFISFTLLFSILREAELFYMFFLSSASSARQSSSKNPSPATQVQFPRIHVVEGEKQLPQDASWSAIVSTSHKLGSSRNRRLQVRKCPHQAALWISP